ncbi:WbqC family protein [Sphingobium sufflavum]|uniref:WbqC family protein n=1 Tax=Sphingobium sufflavum TaxID=1129547 RepID=UPI001F2A377D|nr:WbqC family protein [Sphingobium sufflavum]MCE7795616.1 WbqC family protein [Sphingobium sufflavum]
MTAVVISQPMLFPWPGFFEQVMLADVYVDLDDVQFSKGSFTNRIQLKFAEGRRWMTVPLAGKGSFQVIADLQAADGDWRIQHREMVRESLQDAPYLADALAIMDEAYAQERLCDLLIASIDLPAAYLGIRIPRRVGSHDLGIGGQSWSRVLDMVRHLRGDRYVTAHGAARYLDHPAFEAAGVAVDYVDYSCTPWPQGPGDFTPYVSILDLIARTGPQAVGYLKPRTLPWRAFLDRTEASA